MVDLAIKTISPLIDRPPYLGSKVQISERPFIAKLTLRGNPDDVAFLKAVEGVLGHALPVAPNTTVLSKTMDIAWVGPDEWMIYAEADSQSTLVADLRKALEGQHSAVVDVSDYYTLIRVTGAKARATMAKGCPLDLDPVSFGPGDCAGTLYIKSTIRLIQRDDAPSYDIQVRWSHADYLWQNLVVAAKEWG